MADRFDGLETQLLSERRKVDVSNVDFSARELVRMYIENELIIAPSYQRKYRWPKDIASRFIESIFLGLPIPPIFVATNDNFTWEVVDGLQRISTLILYMSEDSEARSKISSPEPLKLQNLDNLSQLNGTTYADLPKPLQLYLARQPLQVVSLTDKSDKSVRFNLFERLNTGSISLSPQEVRTAVYGGEFLSFIERLANNDDLNTLLKLQAAKQHDGTTAEQVLKFFAYKNDSASFSGAVTKFLNEFVAKVDRKDIAFDYQTEEWIFNETMSLLVKLTDGPFLRNATTVTPLVQFEATTVGIGHLLHKKAKIVDPPTDWLEDPTLVTASTGGTNTSQRLAQRINRVMELFSDASNNE